ncbi:MAG: hypothetical protein OEZ47_15870, partial [Gammaproteobacteria bacterium]|nr:hypothetical protein [Gammaproteobacteria bacterium]
MNRNLLVLLVFVMFNVSVYSAEEDERGIGGTGHQIDMDSFENHFELPEVPDIPHTEVIPEMPDMEGFIDLNPVDGLSVEPIETPEPV